ncbi:hypothetical protein HDU82_006955 [Entophlyctis luteolus]|nr:hypothetical protein HDU82_006955 [Entophlyctis luteolus]KAJ3393529.1 hypothetical protein HDU84_001659 [Entophlyctis sp. JEL0112]
MPSDWHVSSASIIAEIQRDFGAIDLQIALTASEITYSRFSVRDYSRIVTSFKSVAAVLFSLHTSLYSDVREGGLGDAPDGMKQGWIKLDWSCQKLFNAVSSNLKRTGEVDETLHERRSLEAIAEVVRNSNEGISSFETHQPVMFLDIFEVGSSMEFGARSLDGWEKLMRLTFYVLAAKELVAELTSLHNQTIRFIGVSRSLKIHMNEYLPERPLEEAMKALRRIAFFDSGSLRAMLLQFKQFFESPRSIYGLKFAMAIFCLQMSMFSQPEIFKQWYLSGAVGITAVTLTPSLGQTYVVLPLTIGGISVGAIIAYLSVTVFGKSSYAHVAFGALIGIPFFYLQLFNPRTATLGLLAMLAYSNYICNSYANISSNTFDSPPVYLYKVISVLSGTVSFAVILNLLVYPSFARHILRDQMSEIFVEFGTFYRKIASNMYPSPEDASQTIVEDSDIKDVRNDIFSRLVALEQLLVFSSAEPRLEGPFPTQKYRKVVECMYTLLDRLECLRLSAGKHKFEPDVEKAMNSDPVGDARVEMIQTLRLLLHLYSLVMKTKQKILPSLPNATRARQRLITSFISILLRHSMNKDHLFVDPLDGIMPFERRQILEALNSEKWMRLLSYFSAIREVSRELDGFSVPMKSIFGEYPDVLKRDTDGGRIELTFE